MRYYYFHHGDNIDKVTHRNIRKYFREHPNVNSVIVTTGTGRVISEGFRYWTNQIGINTDVSGYNPAYFYSRIIQVQ